MFLDPLFKVMAKKQASDLYITAGAPIQLKVTSVAAPISSQPMPGARKFSDVNQPSSADDLSNFKFNLDVV